MASSEIAEIYVFDQNPRLRSIEDLRASIVEIATNPPYDIIEKTHGFIVKFHNESDCNFIFAENTKSYLATKQLTAALTKRMQSQRVIYIPNFPEHLFTHSDNTITANIELSNISYYLTSANSSQSHPTRNLLPLH